MEDISIQISLNTAPPMEELRVLWQTLQAKSNHSFFQSWAWIGSWLSALPKNLSPLFLKAERAGEIVGGGILLAETRARIRLFETPVMYLNSTGDPYFDEITVEYNGFLAERSDEANIVKHLLSFLFTNREHRCNEVFIDGSSNAHSLERIVPTGTRVLVSRVRGCYAVDLDALRSSEKDYVSTLGSTRRYNIRRSIKEYSGLAPLNIAVASSMTEANLFLKELRLLHQAYWQGKDSKGAFANQFFCEFIQNMITSQFANGVIQLLRVCAGNRPIGYLLNFVYQGHVYQYQSGFDYGVCDKYNSPGYVSHIYAVEHNIKIGHHTYDYMAGDSDYKKALGKLSQELYWQVIQRDTFGFRIEDRLRHTVRKVRNISRKRNFFAGNRA
jgi:CelD/BcsL family acetyltransferase involved in cellulose biosynthesis